jgi:WD40 repeat protein
MAHRYSFLQDANPPDLLIGKQKISRRTILQSLAGLALAGGSITSFLTSCASQTSTGAPTNTSTATQITPPPIRQNDTFSSLRTALYTYRGHSASVNAVAWSPNGMRIASGSNDGTVQVWDAANGGHVYTYHGHADRVVAVAWSPDGTRIASGSDDNTAQVWDSANGRHLYAYRGHTDAVWSVTWSPDGKRIVSGSGNIDTGRGDTTAQVWDAADGGHVTIYLGHSGPVWTVAWSPKGTLIASGSADMTVQLWRTP